MPSTTTLADLLTSLAEELDLGLVLDDASATTTVITETTTGASELRGPFTGLKIPVGSPVTVITGTAGEDSFVQSFSPSAGTLTLLPAITTGSTKFIIWKPVVKHGKNIEKAISRAHQKCRRWMKVVLTYVPDGELLAATVTDFWTASAGTPSYSSLTGPEVSGARALNLTHSAAATLTGNTISVRPGEVWRFETAIRATTAAGVTAGLVIVDVTNTSTITPSFEEGDGTTTSNAFMTQRGSFTVPTNCDQIAVRLTLDASGAVQMAPVVAYPQDARSFPFTNRVLGIERIGDFYYSRGGGADSGPDERSYTEPITIGGRTAAFSNDGDHLVVIFNFAPCAPVYYDELIHGNALTALTDTTTFPAEYVKRWARAEIYDFLMRGEATPQARAENGAPLPSTYRQLRNAAVRSAKFSTAEPLLKQVAGRR